MAEEGQISPKLKGLCCKDCRVDCLDIGAGGGYCLGVVESEGRCRK